MGVNPLVVRALGRLGLLRPAYRMYEGTKAVAYRGEPEIADELPVPPAWLRVRVTGTPDVEWFLASGRQSLESIRLALAAGGTRIDDFGAILDFGCGCGRVVRNLRGLRAEIHGSDLDGPAIRWCKRNLRFASFSQNTLRAELPFENGRFDFIYALSVFTHLRIEQQRDWMRELVRVARPDGLILLSTHGERYLDRLSDSERLAFEGGEIVVRRGTVAGMNLCTAFHPPETIRHDLGSRLEVVYESLADPASDERALDVFLFRVPDPGG